MGYAFENFTRPSCYECRYKGKNIVADITLGDFWGNIHGEKFWNEKGVSLILVHTNRGRRLIESIDQSKFAIYESKYELALRGNPYLEKSIDKPTNREEFSKWIRHKDLNCACRKCQNIKERIKNTYWSVLQNFNF